MYNSTKRFIRMQRMRGEKEELIDNLRVIERRLQIGVGHLFFCSSFSTRLKSELKKAKIPPNRTRWREFGFKKVSSTRLARGFLY